MNLFSILAGASRARTPDPTRIVFALILPLGVAAPHTAFAQSHWGISASFTPKWTDYQSIREQVLIDGDGTFEGTQFTVGIVRGSTGGASGGELRQHAGKR